MPGPGECKKSGRLGLAYVEAHTFRMVFWFQLNAHQVLRTQSLITRVVPPRLKNRWSSCMRQGRGSQFLNFEMNLETSPGNGAQPQRLRWGSWGRTVGSKPWSLQSLHALNNLSGPGPAQISSCLGWGMQIGIVGAGVLSALELESPTPVYR